MEEERGESRHTFLRDDLWPTVIAVMPISLMMLYTSASLPSLNADVASSSTERRGPCNGRGHM